MSGVAIKTRKSCEVHRLKIKYDIVHFVLGRALTRGTIL